MIADVITIGDEILIGQIVDTNSAWIAQELNKIGVKVRQMRSIADDASEIKNTLDSSLQSSQIIIITGGIGPTNDDITKKTLAEYFGTSLELHQDAYKKVESFVLMRGGQMNQGNTGQAMLPKNAKVFLNDLGTASGMCFEKQGRYVFSLPGVPYEMKHLMLNGVLDFIKEQFKTPNIHHKTVLTSGISESKLADMIQEWEAKLPGFIKLAYLPSPGLVKLRLSASGESKQIIENSINSQIAVLKTIIKDAFLGYDEETHVTLLSKLLLSEKATLAVAESCSGGSLAHHITSEPGASDYFIGGIVAYSNQVKINELNVAEDKIRNFGAVSQQVVEEMAVNIRKKFDADYAIATSGIAGPGGGTIEKPVGTVWIAIAGKDMLMSEKFLFGNIRENVIKRTSLSAMMMLIQFIRAKTSQP